MVQEIHSALTRQFKTLRLLYLLCLLLAVAALAAYFVDRRLTLAVLGVNALFYLLAARPRAKAYQRACIQGSIRLTLSRYLADAAYASPALDPSDIQNVHLAAEDGSLTQKEGGRGLWQGHGVRVCEVVLGNSFYRDARHRAAEFLAGTWVQVELGRDTGLDCRLISRKLMNPLSRAAYFARHGGLHEVEDGLPPPLAEGWLVMAGETDALPSDHVLKHVKKLASYTPAPMALAVTDGTLSVFLRQRLLWRKVSARQAPTRDWLEFDLLPELGYILEIARRLTEQ